MATKTRVVTAKSKLVLRISEFGPAPILEGESNESYNELLARVSGDVNPSDTFEEIWVRDIVDLTWDIMRYRRIKTNILSMGAGRVLITVKLDMESAIARGFLNEIDNIARVDHLLAIAEGRRNAALREIDRHRAIFASTLHDSIQNVENAEFKTIEGTARKVRSDTRAA